VSEKNNASWVWNIRFLTFVVLVTLIFFLYRKPLQFIFTAALQRQDSSHGIIVPIIFLYFIWLKLDQIKKIRFATAFWSAILMFLVGIILVSFSDIPEFSLAFHVLSFIFMISGSILLLFGRQIFMETFFPLVFLVTMIPLPQNIYNWISEWLRYINTAGSIAVAKIFGVPIYREGYDVYIPKVHFIVDYGCSGIRYLLSFFTFSIVYVYLFKAGFLSRILYPTISIPLAIIAGTARLSIVFLAAYYISPFWGEHRPHVFLSWVVFILFLFGSVVIDRLITRKVNPNSNNQGEPVQ
jgi:exosortase